MQSASFGSVSKKLEVVWREKVASHWLILAAVLHVRKYSIHGVFQPSLEVAKTERSRGFSLSIRDGGRSKSLWVFAKLDGGYQAEAVFRAEILKVNRLF